ncbi:MAG: hypothetical protein RL654_2112 [Pseudomonadota bacterium]
MKNTENVERAADIVREALNLMRKYSVPMHPVNYAVWYAYASGDNLDLRNAIDRYMLQHLTLDEAVTEVLYRRHVIGHTDPGLLQRMGERMNSALGQAVESAARAGDQTAAYGSSLSRFQDGLAGQALPGLEEILATTRQMQAAIQALQRQLGDSRQEIGQLRDELERVRQETLTDTLTGLPNRRAFEQRLAACMTLAASAGMNSHAPCLLMLDIDHFKRVNDSYGHGTGDQVLCAVATALQAGTPDNALAARIGGEEFVMLLPAMQLQGARTVAEQLRQKITLLRTPAHSKTGAELQVQVTVSIGLTSLQRGETGRQFIERADQALYQSKNGGRDRITVRMG